MLHQALTVLCLLAAVSRTLTCPEYCDCYPGEDKNSTLVMCRGGNITTVPTNFPTNTTYLDIEFSNITMLRKGDFLHLPSLKSIRIFWNLKLTVMDVDTFDTVPTITDLSIANCSFTKFPSGILGSLHNLKTYDGNHNQLEMIQSGLFTDHPNIELINLWQNNISYLEPKAFSGMPHLKSITLMNNKLASLSQAVFMDSPNIQSLLLSFNAISKIDANTFTGLDQLQSVNLQHNMLVNIDDVFGNLPSLNMLTLTSNVLESVHKETFGDLPSLAALYLDKNKISEVDTGALGHLKGLQQLYLDLNMIEELSLAGLHSLQELYLSDNRLRSFPSSLADVTLSLQVLALENNPIEEPMHAGQFSDLTSLQRLTLDNITSLQDARTLDSHAFCGLENLYLLSLTYNGLASLHTDVFDCVPQLTYLYLDYNNLTELGLGTFKALKKVTELRLSYNKLSHIYTGTFNGLEKLFFLALGGNNFTNILHVAPALEGLPSLDTPALDANYFVYIGPDSFPDNMAIDLLNLSGNKIRIIDEGALTAQAFPKMTRVWLDEGNPLHFLPEKFIDGLPQFKTLTVGDDPFNCDCQLKDFATWLRTQMNPPNVYLVCNAPPHLKGKYLKDVALEDLTCNCDHEEAPSIDTSGSDNHTSEGQSAMLNCKISACPEAEFFWTTPTGAMLAVGSGFPRMEVLGSGSLVLTDARAVDTGVYTCTAVNYRGKDSKEIPLRVSNEW